MKGTALFLNSRWFAYDARGSLGPYCEMESGGEESDSEV